METSSASSASAVGSGERTRQARQEARIQAPGVQKKVYWCWTCNRSFQSSQGLAGHSKAHNKTGVPRPRTRRASYGARFGLQQALHSERTDGEPLQGPGSSTEPLDVLPLQAIDPNTGMAMDHLTSRNESLGNPMPHSIPSWTSFMPPSQPNPNLGGMVPPPPVVPSPNPRPVAPSMASHCFNFYPGLAGRNLETHPNPVLEKMQPLGVPDPTSIDFRFSTGCGFFPPADPNPVWSSMETLMNFGGGSSEVKSDEELDLDLNL